MQKNNFLLVEKLIYTESAQLCQRESMESCRFIQFEDFLDHAH